MEAKKGILCCHLDKLWCELERRALEAEVVARGVGQHEAKVDVDDVTLGVHHDVAVVPGGGSGGRGGGGQ